MLPMKGVTLAHPYLIKVMAELERALLESAPQRTKPSEMGFTILARGRWDLPEAALV